ncbi:MAG: hypothetical protein A3I66_06720 [Burkholderiales bacterium RIFCSPLOWO2_02_FULL_57_36]|nr:MAG: hypothetical protein A3I66_06720 [Burkholderiales bacterium RIFCSPLOWO2_02_FULL_57_36]
MHTVKDAIGVGRNGSKAHDDAIGKIDNEGGAQISHEGERQHGSEHRAEQPTLDARVQNGIHLYQAIAG